MTLTPSRFTVLAACLAALAVPAIAQPAYPSQTIHLVVPFPAGGTADQVARTIAQPLARALGQAIVVDNRPGADGAMAGTLVAGSAPDGYTLLFGTNTPLNAAPVLRKVAPYDPLTQFAPISRLGTFGTFLVVSSQVPATTVAELVAFAREHPGKVNYASGNTQSILASPQLRRVQGLDMVHVSYKGDVVALPDLVMGRYR